MINSFMGFSKVSPIKSYNDSFDVDIEFDGDIFFAVSKSIFAYNDEDNDGNPVSAMYKYCIEGSWCDGKMMYILYICPMADSLNKELLVKISDSCGVAIDEITMYDICAYGCAIPVASDVRDCEDIESDILDWIASSVAFVDGMRGFYFDKPINMIGTNGWDFIEWWLNNINPFDRCRLRK